MVGKSTMLSFAFLAACLAMQITAFSAKAEPTATAWSKVFVIGTGPGEERIRIKTTSDYYDVGCHNKEKEYTTDPKTPNSKLIHNLLFQALANGNEVQLILDGCYKGAPRIIDLYITSNK